MSQLIKHRAIVPDRWTLVRDAQAIADLPDPAPVIVSQTFWRTWRPALIARGEVGVCLKPDDDPAHLAEDIGRLPLIAVDFPVFSDGRGYSHARVLRERYGYVGELRAVGDILRDQLYYLSQCGFDAFVIRQDRDAKDALKGLVDFSDGYQLTQRRTPWFRRRYLGQQPDAGVAGA